MKRRLSIFFALCGIAIMCGGQSLRPVSVIQSLRGTNGLVSMRPITNQSVLVLGEDSPLDVAIRLAIHSAAWGAANDVDVFDAVGGGQWKLVELATIAAIPSSITLHCPDDGSNHEFSVTKAHGAYSWQLGQANSLNNVSQLVIRSDDTTDHEVTVSLQQGVYVLTVDQSDSNTSPSTLTLRSSDASNHAVEVVNDQGVYGLSLSQ